MKRDPIERSPQPDAVRLDVWLDVACLFRTRSEAQNACRGGKVTVNAQSARSNRLVRSGDDIVIAPDCKSVQLRSERKGNGNGRVYKITFEVTDSSGNVSTATAIVTVPKAQNGDPAVDDGAQYTVNSACP